MKPRNQQRHSFNCAEADCYGLHAAIILNSIDWLTHNRGVESGKWRIAAIPVNSFIEMYAYLTVDEINAALEVIRDNCQIGIEVKNDKIYFTDYLAGLEEEQNA